MRRGVEAECGRASSTWALLNLMLKSVTRRKISGLESYLGGHTRSNPTDGDEKEASLPAHTAEVATL